MVVIKFATESMRGAAMVAASSRSRREGAEVEQQGPAAQAEFRVKLMAVQAAASRHSRFIRRSTRLLVRWQFG